MEAGRPWVAEDVPLGKARALRRVREFLFQEREIGRDLHRGSEVSPEGAGLQGGEERVEFGEVGSLAGLSGVRRIRRWRRSDSGGDVGGIGI